MSDDVIAAMARLKKALEKRMRLAERAEELAARWLPSTWPGWGGGCGRCSNMTGAARRPIAAEIGVTASDLSRVMAGQSIAYEKVRAICEWAGLSPERFYRRPAGAPKPRRTPRKAVGGRQSAVGECFTGKALKQAVGGRQSAVGLEPGEAMP